MNFKTIMLNILEMDLIQAGRSLQLSDAMENVKFSIEDNDKTMKYLNKYGHHELANKIPEITSHLVKAKEHHDNHNKSTADTQDTHIRLSAKSIADAHELYNKHFANCGLDGQARMAHEAYGDWIKLAHKKTKSLL